MLAILVCPLLQLQLWVVQLHLRVLKRHQLLLVLLLLLLWSFLRLLGRQWRLPPLRLRPLQLLLLQQLFQLLLLLLLLVLLLLRLLPLTLQISVLCRRSTFIMLHMRTHTVCKELLQHLLKLAWSIVALAVIPDPLSLGGVLWW